MDYIEDDILITFTADSTEEARFALCKRHGLIAMRGLEPIRLWLVKIQDGLDLVECIARVNDEPIVERASKNMRVSAPEISVSDFGEAIAELTMNNQWHHTALETEAAWELVPATVSTPVVIAQIDTGIKASLPEFAGRIAAGGWNCVNNSSNTDAIDPHGTATAGVMVANRNGVGTVGVNPRAMVIPFVAFGGSGVGTVYTIADALIRASQSGADIVSMSFGAPPVAELSAAIQACVDSGLILSASAGNDQTTAVHYPSDYNGAISVGGTSKDDGWGYLYSKSNYGMKVDVAAPGEMVAAPHSDGTIKLFNGTSLACPQCSGVVSLVLETIGYSIPWQDMQMLLQASCEKINIGTGNDAIFRSGRLNARLACENAARYKNATAPELVVTYPTDMAVVLPSERIYAHFTVFGDSPITQAVLQEGSTVITTVANPAKPYILTGFLPDTGVFGERVLTLTVQDSQGRATSKTYSMFVTNQSLSGMDFLAFWHMASTPGINPLTGFLEFDLLMKGYDGSSISPCRITKLEQVGDATYMAKTETERAKASIKPFKVSPPLPLENVNWCQPNELVQSNIVTVSDINTPVHCNILGAGDLKLNGGSWQKGPVIVVVNDTLQVRTTSGGTQGAISSVSLVVGGSVQPFTLTTRDPSPPTSVTVNSGDGSLIVAWGKVTGATKYEIIYGTTTEMTNSTGWLGDVSAHTILGLQNGVLYYVSVRAGDVDRFSAYTVASTQTPAAWDTDVSGWVTQSDVGSSVVVSDEQAYEGTTSFKFTGYTDTEAGAGMNASIVHSSLSLDGKTKLTLRYKEAANPGGVTIRVMYYNTGGISVVAAKNYLYYMDGQWHLLEFALSSAQGSDKTVFITVFNYDFDGGYVGYIDKIEAV